MLKNRYLILIIFIIIFFVSANVIAVEIDIPAQVQVRGEQILLGEISQISGENKEIIENIKTIELAKSPLPGYSKKLSRELIRLILKNKGYDLKDIELDIPDVFTVSAKSKKIAIENVLKFAREYIKENISYGNQQIEVKINSRLNEIVIPDSDYSFAVEANKEIGLGNNSLPLIINVNGKEYKRIYLMVEVNLIKNVYIARKDLEQAQQLKREDFRLERREINDERGTLIIEWKQDFFENRVLTNPLQKGEILKEDMLKKPVVINWGDKVQALVKIGSVEIATLVSAREKGKVGDYITVENIKTGHKFKARVVNSQLVEITDK